MSFFAKLKSEAAVGVFALFAIGLLLYASVRVTGWKSDLGTTYRISVLFENGAGLSPGTAVRAAGIKIGELDSIELSGGQALANMSIFGKYHLKENTVASVKSLGVLGDKYIELTLSDTGNFLEDGDRITLVRSGSDLDSLIESVSHILNDVQSVTSALSQSMGGEEGAGKFNRILENTELLTQNLKEAMEKTNHRIDSVLINFENFSKNLNTLVSENQGNVKTAVKDFAEFSAELKGISKDNRQKIDNLLENLELFTQNLREETPQITKNLNFILSENRESIRNSLTQLDSATEKLDLGLENFRSITGKIDKGEGTIGKLVNDEETVERVNEALTGINDFLLEAGRLKLDLGFKTDYLAKSQKFKSVLSINFRPLRDHFYSLELVKNPRGKNEKTTTVTSTDSSGTIVESTKTETKNTDDFLLSLQIGQRYYDSQFRIGLYENTFGLGAEQFFGIRDQYRLYAHIWDLARKDEGAHLNVGGSWNFTNNFFLAAGVDDSLNEKTQFHNFYIGVGLMFNEDNLKLLTGSLPISNLAN